MEDQTLGVHNDSFQNRNKSHRSVSKLRLFSLVTEKIFYWLKPSNLQPTMLVYRTLGSNVFLLAGSYWQWLHAGSNECLVVSPETSARSIIAHIIAPNIKLRLRSPRVYPVSTNMCTKALFAFWWYFGTVSLSLFFLRPGWNGNVSLGAWWNLPNLPFFRAFRNQVGQSRRDLYFFVGGRLD